MLKTESTIPYSILHFPLHLGKEESPQSPVDIEETFVTLDIISLIATDRKMTRVSVRKCKVSDRREMEKQRVTFSEMSTQPIPIDASIQGVSEQSRQIGKFGVDSDQAQSLREQEEADPQTLKAVIWMFFCKEHRKHRISPLSPSKYKSAKGKECFLVDFRKTA